MNIKPIKTNRDHEKALEHIDKLWGAKKGTVKGDELEILITLIEAYEAKYYPIEAADPVEAIEYLMEERKLKQSDLIKIFGSKSLVSEVLSKKRELTLKMIKALHNYFGIPYEILIA